MATRQAPCCLLLLLLLLLNPPWRLSKTRPSRLNGKTISNIKFRFLTFDNVPFRVIPSPRGSTSTGPYITLLPVIPLHPVQPVQCINLIPRFAYHPETLTRPLFPSQGYIVGKILDRGARTRAKIDHLKWYQLRPTRTTNTRSHLLPLPLSLISPHTLPHLSFNLQLLYPPDPCCLFHQTRIGLSPPQPRPASSRFSTSFAPQGRKSESEIITVGSADII